jgi:hypothetical protein
MKDTELDHILKHLEKLKQKQKETQEEINTLERTVQNEQNKKTHQPVQDKG